MENMDKELTVPKWVLINRPKIPQMPQNLYPKLSAQAPKFGIVMKKGFIALGISSPCVHTYLETKPSRHDRHGRNGSWS